MLYDVPYISASCNAVPNIADWGRNNLICYGSCNAILIYDINDGGGRVINTLHKHTKRVNAVKWISGDDYETELVSVSSDCKVIVWSKADDGYTPQVLEGHTDVVNIVQAAYTDLEAKLGLIFTGAADSNVKIWMRTERQGEFTIKQTINLDYNICMALRFIFLPKCDKILMGCATDASKILLYINDGDGGEFVKKCKLEEHEDWVCGLDFRLEANGDLLLASCSQDTTIRLWRFVDCHNYEKIDVDTYSDVLLPSPNGTYLIRLESIIYGHEGWVYAVNWSPDFTCLLSASIDKSMIMWEFNEDANVWLENMRVGAIGGNTLGFYGGMFSPDGKGILAHGFHGAFHIWRFDEEMFSWEPQVTIGGHFGEVVDLAWDPKGNYVMTVSYDQTTRIHAPWRKDDTANVTWHEIARPQVHGYDMSCLALFDQYNFASAGDEKVIRIFQAPDNFVTNFHRICQLETDNNDANYKAPKGAAVPSLGLSNKAIYTNDNTEQATITDSKQYYPEESHFTAIDLTVPPTEETLLQNTLWPETQKLYGHGYELYALAASPDGGILASSCKATSREHAAVLLWDTKKWQIVQKLHSHQLTIAQLAFSPDGHHLLSVSRDRRWSLFSKAADTDEFELAATTDQKCGIHTRIIWCCAWSHDSKYFITGSRDGKAVVWRRNPDKPIENVLKQYEPASDILNMKNESITAVAFAPAHRNDDYLIALGTENGSIDLYKWNTANGFRAIGRFGNNVAHHLTVKRLAFRPLLGETGAKKRNDDILQLASCSSDCSLRIYNIHLNNI